MADVLPFLQQTQTGIKPGIQQVETSEAPVSRISGAEVAQPYQELARGLDKGGEGLEAVAVPLAERAGAQAVTRDADGNIQVEHMPIFGLAGTAYARAVKVGALAEADGAAERQDIGLRQQFRDNPDGYVAAATAYKQKAVTDMTAAAGPEVGTALGRAIDSKTTLTYRGLLNEKEKLDLARADGAITAGVNSASDDAMALARGGADPNDPAMKQALDKYTTLLDEKLKNPRLAYTQEQHDLDIQHFQGELAGQRNLYHIDQVYKGQGYQAAEEAAKDILTNPDYKLSEAQRQQYYSRSLGEIRLEEGIKRQARGEATIAFQNLETRSAIGAPISPDEVDTARQMYRDAGYPAGVAMVDRTFAHKNLNDDHGRLPVGQQTQDLVAIQGATAARDAMSFFKGKGYSDAQAAGIVGNLVHESGLNPGIAGDAGTSGGLAQFHAERLTALKAFATSQGKPWTDFQTQLQFIDRELHTTESGTFIRLQNSTTPEEAAAAFVHYERPAGYTPDNPGASLGFQSRLALARAVAGGGPTDGSGGPGVHSWLIANRSAALNTAATKEWKDITAEWQTGSGAMPSDEKIDEIATAARVTGNIDLSAKIAKEAAIMHDVARIRQLPLSQQIATETELRRQMATGSAFAGADAVEKQLTEKTNKITEGLKDDPIATAVANFPDKFKTPAPLDFSDPQKLTAGLAMRGQIAQIAAQNWQTGPLAALDKQDVMQVKAALANPDPAVKAGIYGAIATLPEDVRGATLKKLGGNEPAGMAEAAAGSMMATAPDIAASIFRGQTAMKTDSRYDPEHEQGETKQSYRTDLDKVLPANVFTLQDRTDPAGAYATTASMVKARYADLSAQSGQTTYNKARLEQAVTDVTGGILSHNGGDFIAPARGMSQRQFDGVLQGVTDDDLGHGALKSNLSAAQRDLNLTPQETAFYQRHLTNLTGPGGVDNPDGSRSSLYQSSVEVEGKTYNIPTVWDGKILKPADALVRAKQEGLDKFPSYGSEDEAEARYQKMHDYMEKDTQQFLSMRGGGVQTLNGTPVTAQYLRGNAQLESVGDGRYFVKLGRDPMAPIYAYQGDRKFVLDLRGRAPAPLTVDSPPPAVSP